MIGRTLIQQTRPNPMMVMMLERRKDDKALPRYAREGYQPNTWKSTPSSSLR
jgi:hypothetical protein